MTEGTAIKEQTKIKVLHVDDDPAILSIAKEILEAEDKFQVESASSVEEAQRKLKEQPFEAIISDYEMPNKTGLQFLEEIRQQKNEIAFVMFTGRGREEVAVRALNLGADRYINKNGDPEAVYCELSFAVAKIVERKRARRMLIADAKKINQLNEKLRVVGSLTRHDVRNKLSAINAHVYLLKKKLAQDPAAMNHLLAIDLSSKQIVELLEFSHLYEKLGVEELQGVDVGKCVNDALGLFVDLRGIRVENQCCGLTVMADSLLRQLFYNLIDNSLKHGQKIASIRIYAEENEEETCIVYQDDGVGIEDCKREHLFEEKSSRGINHGLYVVRRICEAYDWTIRETGQAGLGAKFIFHVPKSI
ncbi:MAG: hybrid sensor histidine kinase/response regulator [Candidatus Bathyarchaeota archaeon]|nr:hybrid sensor histidine kinase/response regulator [Candidatus Bathyarchaeota archaeon]